MAPQMSLLHSDGALKIVDADEESGFTFFDSSFIETGLRLEELKWKFYEKSAAVGPPLSVEVSNSPPMAMEANLVRVPVGDIDRPFFPLPSDAAAPADSLACEGVGPHPHSDRRSSPLMANQVFFGKDSPELVKQPPPLIPTSIGKGECPDKESQPVQREVIKRD
ncbi:unnamed protein product [Lactuca virosa]|uniref:Uncharacterized protein n=1 Tax=Lactuca virosa TaxID=75947 RepID=A0AAU9PA30_9ASTR|nr:unnamed protein product [Lactuca virosa]